MIEKNINQKDKLEKLNITAKKQISIFTNNSNVMGITKLDNQKLIESTNE